MKTLATLVTLVGCLLPALALAGQERKPYPTMGKIIRLDPRFDELVPKDAAIEKLAAGFKWSEGPVWIKDGGYLLFSDIPRKRINKWKEGEGISVFLEPSGYTGSKPRGGEPGSNGLLLDAKGRLVLCEHGDRRVSRLEKNGKKSVLADKYMGKRLNSPNDACFHSNGDLYFTDPPYGLEKVWDDPARELDFCGVYRVSAKSKKITLLTKEMSWPNGIAFSPDQKTLYVANSDPEKAIWKAFPVMKDGTLGEGRVFFDATAMSRKKKGLPDGLRVDHQGHIFATGPGGVLVFSPKGEHLGSIETGVATANCGWGNDGSTLYITADSNLCRIKLSTKGKGF